MESKIIDWVCVGTSTLATISQTDVVLRYIQLGLTILSAIIVIINNIIEWYKKAKADGKISSDEVKEVIKIAQNGVDDVSKIIKESEDKK